jgi:hypothetical protein
LNFNQGEGETWFNTLHAVSYKIILHNPQSAKSWP